MAYGANRADWSYVPGGVISGTALIRPDLPELKIWPYFWQLSEYVMGGGASDYMFLALAADHPYGRSDAEPGQLPHPLRDGTGSALERQRRAGSAAGSRVSPVERTISVQSVAPSLVGGGIAGKLRLLSQRRAVSIL